MTNNKNTIEFLILFYGFTFLCVIHEKRYR
jgi:hypothetical protein